MLHSRSLFASDVDFCGALFHVKVAHEFGLDHATCVQQPQRECIMKRVTTIARWRVPGSASDTVLRRDNIRRSTSEESVHSEELIFAARELLDDLPFIDHLTLLMTYQPCHHSAGNRSVRRPHSKSCTSLILRFLEQHPRLHLTIRCSNIYRAHYVMPEFFDTTSDSRIFAERVQLARAGVALLLDHPRIRMSGFTPDDWAFVTPSSAFFPSEQWRERERADAQVTQFFDTFSLATDPAMSPAVRA